MVISSQKVELIFIIMEKSSQFYVFQLKKNQILENEESQRPNYKPKTAVMFPKYKVNYN